MHTINNFIAQVEMEEHLLDIMYHLPEMEGVERVIITKDTILKGKDPIYNQSRKRKSA